MSTSPFSNGPGDFNSRTRDESSVTATEAKNQFGRLLETVIRGGRVFITRHDAPKAVLISVEDFEALSASAKASVKTNVKTKLNTLRAEYDALVAEMQTPRARAGIEAAFNSSPEELGRVAAEAMSKRD
jgi:antitoxin Phd